MTKQRNWVAKHARSYNRSAVHRDRKKDAKRGVEKHKARSLDRAFSFPARALPMVDRCAWG